MDLAAYRSCDILRETVEEIHAVLGSTLEKLTIERTVIGLFFTGVKLSNGAGGLCYTPARLMSEAACCPGSAHALTDSGRLKGRTVLHFIDGMLSGNTLRRSMGIAVMNALSAVCWERRPPRSYKVKTGVDAFDEAAKPEGGYVAVVGALIPVIRALKRRRQPFGILELDPMALKPDEMKYYVPHQLAAERVSQADLLVISGTTLINGTLEGLLKMRKPDATVIVAGPSASMLPNAFFERGVSMMGGVRVADADRVLDLISEGGSGRHVLGNGAERMFIQSRKRQSGAPAGNPGTP